jgi:hypothetical protein
MDGAAAVLAPLEADLRPRPAVLPPFDLLPTFNLGLLGVSFSARLGAQSRYDA